MWNYQIKFVSDLGFRRIKFYLDYNCYKGSTLKYGQPKDQLSERESENES